MGFGLLTPPGVHLEVDDSCHSAAGACMRAYDWLAGLYVQANHEGQTKSKIMWNDQSNKL